MIVKDIVAREVARQAKFGMEPSWEDFVIAGQRAGIKEVVEWIKANHGHIDRWMKKEERVRHYCPNCDNSVIGVYPSEWQAKLKEWGV